ncbi:MAG: lysine--tRNA ligase [Clostridia bacterium]
MHWSEKAAREVIKKYPNCNEYVCAAGISPSGSVHIGNFRDIATAYYVTLSLRRLGKKAKMLFSWDEYDRFRKVPANIKAIRDDYEQYIGLPYSKVPDPFGCHESYAKHFEAEFEKALKLFGVELEYKYQAENYLSGMYKEKVMYAIDKRLEIYDIIMDQKTQEATAEEREAYYPVNIYCDKCGKDNTTITNVDDNYVADYTCACGNHGKFDFKSQFNCKLAWKIDWPMRWQYEGVTFEPGGKDHAAPGGSYDVSKIISKQIFKYEPPAFIAYEFIGIKGNVGKMSSSTGFNLTPETLLKVYQPEVILWLYSKTDPIRAFDFCFDEEILRQYFEFDKMLNDYYNGKQGPAKEIMEIFMTNRPRLETVPMAQLVNFGPIVNWDADLLETLLSRIGAPYTKEQFLPRLKLAKSWLELCSPESLMKLKDNNDELYYNTLSNEEKQTINLLYQNLNNNDYDLEGIKSMLYAVVTEVYGDIDMEQKKIEQAKFFKNVYTLLIGKETGPRLYLFLAALDKSSYLKLLNF